MFALGNIKAISNELCHEIMTMPSSTMDFHDGNDIDQARRVTDESNEVFLVVDVCTVFKNLGRCALKTSVNAIVLTNAIGIGAIHCFPMGDRR